MKLSAALRSLAVKRQRTRGATQEIPIVEGTVIEIGSDGTPKVTLDTGETVAAPQATDEPLSKGSRVYVLPAPDGQIVIGTVK